MRHAKPLAFEAEPCSPGKSSAAGLDHLQLSRGGISRCQPGDGVRNPMRWRSRNHQSSLRTLTAPIVPVMTCSPAEAVRPDVSPVTVMV